MQILAFALASLLAANPYLEQARAHYEQLRYEEAEARLALAKEVESSTRQERAEVFELLALCQAAQGKLDEAEASFAELLSGDPQAAMPSTLPPRLKERFHSAKRRLYPPGFLRLERLASAPLVLKARLIDPWGAVERLVLIRGEATRELERPTTEWLTAPLPEGPWVLQARAADGAVLGELKGGLQAPIAAVQVSSGQSRKPRWAPITLTALAAASALTAIICFIAGAADVSAAPRAHFASEVRSLEARARGAFAAGSALGGVAVAGALLAIWLFVEPS